MSEKAYVVRAGSRPGESGPAVPPALAIKPVLAIAVVLTGVQTELVSVRCVSAKDCWAVGFSRNDPNPDLNLILHWNSVKWSAP